MCIFPDSLGLYWIDLGHQLSLNLFVNSIDWHSMGEVEAAIQGFHRCHGCVKTRLARNEKAIGELP
jgi:hypothetical protein